MVDSVQVAAPRLVADKEQGPPGRVPVVVPGLNPTYQKPGRGGGVQVGAGVGQFSPKIRLNLEKAMGEDGRGSMNGGMREVGGGSGSVATWKGGTRGR